MADTELREALLSAFKGKQNAKTAEELLNAANIPDRRAAQREIPLLIQAGFLEVTKDFKLVPANEEK